MKKLTLFLLLWVLFLFIPHEAGAQTEFFDGKLRIKGRFEQYMVFLTNLPREDSFYRNRRRLDVNQTIFTLEGLYTLVDNDEWVVNFQSYLRYHYDSAPDLDHRLPRSFSSKRRLHKKYQINRYDTDDWINEMYLDIYKGPWNIRLGKQVVVWSEVEMVQTIDKINPIDLRFATPGIQPFDELKLSLWMFRGFYNSDLPGNLIFEHIFIPGDFERTRTPHEGTWASRKPAPGDIDGAPGQGDAVYWMMDQAMPQWSLSNYQYAFRVRGNSEIFFFETPYIIDWTVTYWNGLDTGHAVFEDTERVNAALTRNASFRAVRGEAGPPLPYGRDVASWKRYEAVGAAFQTYVPPLGGVVRGELSYEIGRKWNSVDPYGEATDSRHHPTRVGDVGTFADRTVERDFLSYGITMDKPFCVPFYGNLMQRWGVRPCWDMTFGFFQGFWMGDVKRVWQWSQGYGYSSNTFFTMMIRGGFRHNEFIPVIRALYNPRNFGYVSPGVTYMPGRHVRVGIGAIWFYAKNPAVHRQAAVEDRDMVYMRFRYEF